MSVDGRIPVIGDGLKKWTCDFCHAVEASKYYPDSWGRVVRTLGIGYLDAADACPNCIARMEATGSYGIAARGAYADGPDPRIQGR